MATLTFDIESIPDTLTGRKLYQLPSDMSDEDVAEFMFAKQRARNGSEFLPHYLQRIACISMLLHTPDHCTLWSLTEPDDNEQEIITRFFAGLDKFTPQLISWNGSGFDLPVLHYRALKHGVAAPTYWETGDNRSDFRYNNYVNRYHQRHLDVMDMLSAYQGRAVASLDNIACMLDLPGKQGESGKGVWDYFRQEQFKAIANYCESDVLNTHLIFLRFDHMRGVLSDSDYERAQGHVKTMLKQSEAHHLHHFLDAWDKPTKSADKT